MGMYMKQLAAIGHWIYLFILCVVITGCSSSRKPVQIEKNLAIKEPEIIVAIKGAPDWVNNGSNLLNAREGRLFHGIASAMPMGDLALQKAVADDRARDEVTRVVTSYLLIISKEYVASLMSGESGASKATASEEAISRQITEAVKASLSSTRIIGSWRDPLLSNIWSIAELDMKHVKNSIADAMDMNADLKHYIETEADSIFDRITRERNRFNSVTE
jgi:hypothetical protein